MVIGGLYRCTLRATPAHVSRFGAVGLYLGTQVAPYPSNPSWRVTNHVFLINGKRVLMDKSMLPYMKEITNESR
jgi:hypothetical protein|tara:strand:+ start:321 stop:542 length:222 start_codon:yes stop_codon:yes gene_type:complete